MTYSNDSKLTCGFIVFVSARNVSDCRIGIDKWPGIRGRSCLSPLAATVIFDIRGYCAVMVYLDFF